MGLDELIKNLRKNEQKQIDDIRQNAKDEAEALRQKTAEKIAAITKNHSEQLNAACHESMRSIFSEAEIETREKKLYAYQALEQALRNAALKNLPVLRGKNYEKIFADLVDELPALHWEKIVVNPADQKLAANFFTGPAIQLDASVSGGLIASAADGRIIVDNTFEKRLERKWLHMFPALIAKIEKQYEKSGHAENTG